MEKIQISLILPCYNEQQHVEKSFDSIVNIMESIKIPWEIILIDDKSQDDTVKLIKKLTNLYKNKNIKFYLHKKNKGRGATVSEGFKKAKGFVVGYMDIDCEISPHYIPIFIGSILKGSDIAIAKRFYKFSIFSLHRWLTSKLYSYLVQFVFNLPFHDTESGYKFFNRKKISKVLNSTRDNHWFWDTEIIVKSYLYFNLKIVEVPTIFIRRRDKKSTVNIWSDSIQYVNKLISLYTEVHKNAGHNR